MPNLLKDIILDEISLVDAGTNKDSKVLLFKRIGDNDMSKELEKKIADLTKSVEDLNKLNTEVKSGSDKLNEQIAKLNSDVEDQKKIADEAKSELDKIKNPKKINKEKLPEAVQKMIDDQAAINKSQAEENSKQAEQIAKLKDNEVTKATQIEVAKFDKLALDVDKTVQLFKSLNKEDKEFLSKTFETINTAVEKGDLFKELGGSGGNDELSAMEKINKKAEELLKGNDKLTLHAAKSIIWKSHPDLKKQYEEERKQSH